jgi:type IV secretory pathway TraG/TraD family ATPase VirD4
MKENRVTYFAKTNHRGGAQHFGIQKKDRRYHMYAIGKTGMGKSTMLFNLIQQDIENGEGLAVLDPHGDLAEKIIAVMPEHRKKDLVYLDVTDSENPFHFNPLEITDMSRASLVVSSLMSVFKKIWETSWGPRMEYILRNGLTTLSEFPHATLLDLQRLLHDRNYRKVIVDKVQNPQIKAFWLKEFDNFTPRMQSEAVSPIQNKIGQFLNNPIVKNIVGKRESSFELRDVMDSGKIFLVNLSKGKIGEDSSSLLGAMLVTKIALAALSRQNIPEWKRRDFYLYVDEFQSFTTSGFIDILSEARKYRLNLIFANQYLHQVDEKIMRAILGNVGTLISFRVGTEDAKIISQEFYPVFRQSDLVNLPAYGICLKLMIDGDVSKPFSADTLDDVEITVGE